MTNNLELTKKLTEKIKKFFGSNFDSSKIIYSSELGIGIIIPFSQVENFIVLLEHFFNTHSKQDLFIRRFGIWDVKETLALNFLTKETILSLNDYLETLIIDKKTFLQIMNGSN